ncbi:hypothetical protein V8D89_015204 [Ganoderma adspersum]
MAAGRTWTTRWRTKARIRTVKSVPRRGRGAAARNVARYGFDEPGRGSGGGFSMLRNGAVENGRREREKRGAKRRVLGDSGPARAMQRGRPDSSRSAKIPKILPTVSSLRCNHRTKLSDPGPPQTNG